MFDSFINLIDKFLDLGGLVMEWFLGPFHKEGTNKSLTSKNLVSNLKRAGVGQMLPYRIYREIDGVGIYTGDGDYDDKGHYLGDKHGFILRVNGSAFPNDLMQEQIDGFLKRINRQGVVVNFFNMASQNIENQIKAFEDYHPCNVNVKGVSFLKKLISNRASMLRQWTRESMFGKTGGDLRIKEFVSLVSVLYPENTDMDDVVAQYGTLKSSLGMGSRMLPADELVTILREFFHNEKGADDWMHGSDDYMAINKQVVAGGVEVALDTRNPRINYTINDETHVAVLTTKKFPKRITFSKFNSLFYDRTVAKGIPPIGSPFISTLTLVYANEETVKKKAISKLSHDQDQLSALSAKKLKRKPDLKDRLKETQDGIRAIHEGERILEGMYNIIIFDRDEKSVERSIDGITSSFAEGGWELVPESFDHTAFSQTMFSFPLQFRKEVYTHLERFDMLYRGNFSGIAPIIGDTKGFWKNYHIPYFSPTGQLQWFDPYASDTNYSIATAGDSGSGKSYTFADFAMLNLAAGYQVRIIDSLPSYKRITNMIGGQYEDFTGKDICANFFTNLLEARDKNGNIIYEVFEGKQYSLIDNNEIQTLIPILGMLAGVDIKQIKEGEGESGLIGGVLYSVFEDALRKAWRRRNREAGMKEVYEAISQQAEVEKKNGNTKAFELLYSVAISYKPYAIEGGSGFSFFNGVNNIEMEYDLATFELTALESKGILYEVFLMLLANKIVNEFFGDIARCKCLIIDEFWRYKDLPIVLKFIEELARKARKASGFIVPITQSITDYSLSDGMKNIANSCAFKWILEQNPQVIEKATKDGDLPYSNFILSQIGKIHNNPPSYGEFAIMNGSKSLFTRLKTDRISHWLYTTHSADIKVMDDVCRRFGLNDLESALFCAFRDTFPHSTDSEALMHATTKEDDNWNKYREKEDERNKKIVAMIEKTIRDDDKALELIPSFPKLILDKKESNMLVVIPHLRFGIDELLSPDDYRHITEEMMSVSSLMDLVVGKTIDTYDASRWANIVIDISPRALFKMDSLEIILQVLERANKNYLLQVDFGRMLGEDVQKLDDVISKMTKHNIGLVVKNPTITTPIILLVSDIVKYVTVDEKIVAAKENVNQWIFSILKDNEMPLFLDFDSELHKVPEALEDHKEIYQLVA